MNNDAIIHDYNAARYAAVNHLATALYAGLDIDGTARLFAKDVNGEFTTVNHMRWIEILDRIEAQPGEMLAVCLIRYQSQPD